MPVAQPQATPLSPAEPDHPRRKVRLVRVWAPDGHSEMHTLDNAADLVRRPRDGDKRLAWSFSPRVPPEEDLHAPGEDASPYPVIPADDRPLSVVTLEKLTRAREEAAALGIVVDPSWGLRRLGEEIAKAAKGTKAPAPAPIDEDGDI